MAIKATELRIGNWTEKDGVVVEIDARSIFDIWDDKGLKNYSPIPITEEWLVKLGFKNESYNNIANYVKFIDGWAIRWRIICGRLLFLIEANGGYEDIGEMDILEKCRYIHQLQNLYFALTGEELTIKN